MTSPSTIAQRVAGMHAAMPAEPPVEAMGAFAREQAGLAASSPCRPASPRPGPSCPTRACPTRTARPPPCTPPPAGARRSWSSTGAPGARTATSPCPPTRSSCSRCSPGAASRLWRSTVTLPMPATIILDASRTVRWIDVHPDYSTRTEPAQVIGALDHLGR